MKAHSTIPNIRKSAILALAVLMSFALGLAACSGGQAELASSGPSESRPASASASSDAGTSPSSSSVGSVSEANAGLAFADIPAEAVIDVEGLSALIDSGGAAIIDIRQLGEYYAGHIHNSSNIPAGRQLEIRVREVPGKGTVVLVSQGTEQLAEARQTLIDLGIDADRVKVLDGGMDAWVAAGKDVEMIEEKGC